MTRFGGWLPALVLVAVAARVAAAIAVGNGFHFSDEATYVDTARRVLDGAGFAADYKQTPGYPVLLLVLSAGLPTTVLGLRLAQGVVTGLGTVLVFALGERLVGRGPAVAASAIYALDPLLVVTAGLLYPETTAAVVMVAMILVAWQAGRDSLAASALVGVLLGILALLRPVALVLVPVVAAWIALSAEVPRRRAVAHLGLVLVAALLVLSPWTYRNYRLHGQIAPIATAGTHTAPVPRESVAQEGLTVSMLRKAWTDPMGLTARTGRQFVQFWELAPSRLTTDDPERRARLHRRDPRLSTGSLTPIGLRNLVSTIASAVEFGLALVGFVFLWRTRRRTAILLGAVTIAFALGYALFVAKLRYRIPVLPLVFLLAGLGAWKLAGAIAEYFPRRASTAREGGEGGFT
jgi:4-amino-4-deoxy-L-arabinose transferase-like glycosyltransferase